MAENLPTFSESWYRIADQRIHLRPSVKVQRQFYRGEKWFVLQDPFNNQFFRLRPAAWEFVSRLSPRRTVEEVWKQCLKDDPDSAPGQEEVIRLVSQLYQANLLQYQAPADSSRLFERYRERRQREVRSFWLNIMFLRLPLLDPDTFLNRILPFIRLAFSKLGAVVWTFVFLAGVKGALEHAPALARQSEGILEPSNLFLLYLGLVLVKSLHELGHAAACKRFGGEVHVLGVMLLIFTPVPYMDATSSWGFRSRWHRALVGAAGMIVELFIAALAVLVWANTAPGALHSLAYNIIFVASVSTLLFNLNPLLRYDGYYILSDLLEIPNLYQRALAQIRYYAERHLFAVRRAQAPARSVREAAWLTTFGLTSNIYRIVVFGGILLFVADRFLLIGILMAVACAISWVATPVILLVRYLSTSPALSRNRPRAVAVSSAIAATLLVVVVLVPFPNTFRASGLLEAREKAQAVNEAPGTVSAILTTPGSTVRSGQPLVQLQNRELELQLLGARAKLAESQSLWRAAMQTNAANLKPIERRIEAVQQQVDHLELQTRSLTVRALQDGTWIAPDVQQTVGRWIPRGFDLGLVLNPDSFRFTATVRQTDVGWLFSQNIRRAEVRIRGQAGHALEATHLKPIPAGRKELPSAALGWRSGGDMPVAPNDPEGRRSSEPFFEVQADVQVTPGILFHQGRSGKIRFKLDPQPVAQQVYRRFRQLIQERYKI